MLVVMRKPEMTKKTSTPTKPPGTIQGKAWNKTTDPTAMARSPSMSGRYTCSECFVPWSATSQLCQVDGFEWQTLRRG